LTKKAICIIPARGGSKRIPKKNIKDFFGKPLISYSIRLALDSELFDKVIVSTDDNQIANISQKYGAEVINRPKELADDFVGSGDAVNHAIEYLKNQGEKFDYVCTIYATAPLLQLEYLKKGYEEILKNCSKMTFSVTSIPFPIQRTFKLTKDGRCEMFTPEYFNSRSQDLEEAYQDAGQFYWENINKKFTDIAFGKDSIPIILPRYLVQDIDTLEDWQRAEYMYGAINQDKYDRWNSLKKQIENKKAIQFNQRDILFISMGQNIGFEQYGKGEDFLRPVVVIKKFNKNLFLGVPLSSKIKEGYFFHNITFKDRINSALLLQLRVFDSKRIKYKLVTLSSNEFNKLSNKLYDVLTPLENGERLMSNFKNIIPQENKNIK
jgi:N-acylneuraminate cytidylyltransferase